METGSSVTNKKTVEALKSASKKLQKMYKPSSSASKITAQIDAKAYALTRMPATQKVVDFILTHLPEDFIPSSFLDLGCGTGAASLSVVERWEGKPLSINALDYSAAMLHMYEKNLTSHPSASCINFDIKSTDLTKASLSLPKASLVGLSYVLGEIKENDGFKRVLNHFWQSVQKYGFIVMPGTPEGFHSLIKARDWLLQTKEAQIIAPCPHAFSCPMLEDKNDWCHAKVRLLRTHHQKDLKEATLPYEDEPFSYLLLKRSDNFDETPALPKARIVKRPIKRGGHCMMDVCTEKGTMERWIYGKKDKDLYKDIKKKEWGDGIFHSK
jgi:ribosomal protein RSM22 (predicted rRNA methylase)